MRNVRAHYIKTNDSARIPQRFVILDTEAHRERKGRGEVQSWALAVATFLEWPKSGQVRQEVMRFETPEELWSAISTFTRKGRRTVLYAHNLNYDLRISQALSVLPALSWTLRDMRLDGRGSWSKWSRDKASLTLCDSASIFPVKLELLAPMFGLRKVSLPKSSEREKLFKRCERDVEILTAAIIQYVTWLRTGQCGNWQMTGASQSWSHWRHSHYTHKILVHDNEEALQAERAAMHSGRCEAFRHGRNNAGPYYEYDWQNSYPRIAQDVDVPTRLSGTINSPNPTRMGSLMDRYHVLAELEVTTTVPCVPAQHDDRTLWPVGTFRTTLWSPEIRLLQECGATFAVRRAWLYKKEPALRSWAEWILCSLHDRSDTIEPWKKLILKHWSRALIGRFGMRYQGWEKYGTAPDSRVCMSELVDLENGSTNKLMQVGTAIYITGERKEIDDGCPQITGYIMSEARARLWHVYQDTGPENVLYCDTDSLIVNSTGHKRIQERGQSGYYSGLRSKGRYNSVDIYGPRSILCDTKPIVAGMPRSSVQMDQSTYEGEVWRSGAESVRQGEPNTVRIMVRTFRLQPNEHRRHFLASGETAPYALPGYTPVAKDVGPRATSGKPGGNSYPTLLAPPKAPRRAYRPKHGRHSPYYPVRPVPQTIPAPH